MGTHRDAPAPSERHARAPRGKTSLSCSWLHSLKSWSLLKSRGGSLPHHRHQPLPLPEALLQLCQQPRVLLCERLTVVFLRLSADVAAGGEHKAMLAAALDGFAFAEAGAIAVDPPAAVGRANA